jgi:hypothetical protein
MGPGARGSPPASEKVGPYLPRILEPDAGNLSRVEAEDGNG